MIIVDCLCSILIKHSEYSYMYLYMWSNARHGITVLSNRYINVSVEANQG